MRIRKQPTCCRSREPGPQELPERTSEVLLGAGWTVNPHQHHPEALEELWDLGSIKPPLGLLARLVTGMPLPQLQGSRLSIKARWPREGQACKSHFLHGFFQKQEARSLGSRGMRVLATT